MIGASVADGSATKTERFYAPQIDGLRFIAALLVIIHHSPEVPGLGFIKQAGWIGVDLFLCISAFLLTRLLRIEFSRTGTISIRKFFLRRLLRIWPLYVGYAAVMSIIGSLYFDYPASVTLSWLLSHLTFSANIMTALTDFSPVPFTAHLWTISLEEQAYFVLPFLLLALSHKNAPMRYVVTGTVGVLTMLYAGRVGLWLNEVSFDAIFVTPFRADGLVLGAAAALLFEKRSYPPAVASVTAALAIFVMWSLSANSSRMVNVDFYGFPLLIGACALLLLASLSRPSPLGSKPLAFLGKISFGIYVYHPIAIRVSERLFEIGDVTSPVLLLSCIVLLTIVMASASYRIYEAPFLRLKERFAVIHSRPV